MAVSCLSASRSSLLLFYQGPTHRLEITPPDSEKMLSVLRLSDLSTDEEDAVHCKMNEYEKKIDSLMNVVGTLKNEVRRQCKDLLSLKKHGPLLFGSAE